MPAIYNLDRFFNRKSSPRQSRVCHNAQKGRGDLPGNPDQHAFRKYLLDKDEGLSMLLCALVVGVQKYVGIENDHLCAGPSNASNKSSTLS